MQSHNTQIVLHINVYRPRLSGTGANTKGFINTPFDYMNNARMVVFNVCNQYYYDNVTYTWTIERVNGDERWRTTSTTHDCNLHWRAPVECEYNVRVVMKDTRTHQEYGAGERRNVLVADIWLAIVGDSFASGQGSPDVAQFGATRAQCVDGKK